MFEFAGMEKKWPAMKNAYAYIIIKACAIREAKRRNLLPRRPKTEEQKKADRELAEYLFGRD